MKRPLVGVGVLIKRNGMFLLGKRLGEHGKGEWSLPGGHLEWGESFQECCAREVMEETGLRVVGPIQPLTFTNDIFEKRFASGIVDHAHAHYVTLFFVAECEGEPNNREPDKCAGWEWHTMRNPPLPLFLPLENLFKRMIEEEDARAAEKEKC